MNTHSNKKICFIHTSLPQKAGACWPPLGILHMAALLEKNGHQVTVIDREAAFVKNSLDREHVDKETLSIIKQCQPDYIGISAFTPLISDAYHVAHIIKKTAPNTPILLGGPHATALAKEVLESCPSIDLIVIGEGEYSMLEIASGKDYSDINGIAFRSNEKIISTPDRPPITDLNNLPLPAWDHIDMDLYTRPSPSVIRGYWSRAIPLMTSRGCPFHCAYCAGGLAFKNKLHFFSIDYVITQIEDAIRRFEVDAVYFMDDQFTARPSRVSEFCKRIHKTGLNKKITWAAQVRVDAVTRDTLLQMKEAGCIQVEFGFESNSQPILDLINKRTTVEQNERAAALCNEVGIRMLANLMTNFPEETLSDMQKTINFAKRFHFVHISFQKMVPLPGTPLWHTLKEKGLATEDWKTYDTLDLTNNFTRMPDDQFNNLFLHSREWMGRIDILSDLKSYFSYNVRNLFSTAYVKNILTYIFLFLQTQTIKKRLKEKLNLLFS